MIHAVALDSRRILPVSTVQTGAYGIRDVALSVPSAVGRQGVVGIRQIDLRPKELQGLRTSAGILRQTRDAVLKGR